MYRYLAILWNTHSVESARIGQSFRVALTSKPTEWSAAYQGVGVLAVHTGLRQEVPGCYLLRNGGGVILGQLFDHSFNRVACHRLDSDEDQAQKIVSSGGQHLIDHYWGSYVAIVHDESTSTYHVLREPTSNLPCYHVNYKGVDIFFSHIEDCVRYLPISFPVNRQHLIRWLVLSRLATGDTGLENVEDLGGGERLSLSHGKLSRRLLWDPTEIAHRSRLEQPSGAARALRSTVQSTINAWASCYQNITHRLSGGLDSSIVAGCLAHSPTNPRITCLHLSIDVGFEPECVHLPGLDKRTADKLRAIAGQGDERYFARLVAERWRIPLIERQRNTAMDLTRLWQTPLMVNPALYFTMMEMDDAELELANSHGTQAFFSGQAGDAIFLAMSQPLPAIDYAYTHGIKPGLWNQLVDTANLSRESVWAVFGKVIKHGILRHPYVSPIGVLALPTLLQDELTHDLTNDNFESRVARLALCSRLPPGKKNHVGGLAGSAYYDFVFHSGKFADHIDPLNSQPIWELMLQIPTYTICAGGISRGLARHAFADLLPTEIRRRQVKGTGTSFYQQVVRRNISFLREQLLDGLLVREGYLDRQKLVDCLTEDEPFTKIYASSLLRYLAAEAWLQMWAASTNEATQRQAAL